LVVTQQSGEAARTAWEREAGRDGEKAAALLLLIGSHGVLLIGSDAI
jgi:hypothetical protein